ncbi:MOSC domain-containing protein [Youngiibacter multivorans]|uniref:MOSC domain-containing protein YiiM n=1 Tax=Youngiibacter multivorans TaxID=937251 RepID=A0ABS4G2W8_9CLOT|nr:MOSC domain-containing protein [Youngiibacter multivorans]MBP1918885.1 MOSC domain-containing protein YiiM [Youngiibacter multivorans]
MARVVAVNISDRKGVIKTPVEMGEFQTDLGLKGDAHSGNWHRQVSLLAQESIDKMSARGILELTSGKFAENLTTEGIELFTLPVGTRMEIGEVLMEVTQIGKECHRGCQIMKMVGDCIMPREGIFTKILRNGVIRPGDEIRLSVE